MDVIYGLIPLMIVIGLVMVVVFFWTVKNGQYDDMEGDSHRILMDEDEPVENSKEMKVNKDNKDNKDQRNWPDAE